MLDARLCLKFLLTLNTDHFLSVNINYATEICLRSQHVISGQTFQFKNKTKQLKPRS